MLERHCNERNVLWIVSLTSLDLSSFNTINVKDMLGWLYKFKILNISNFDTRNVNDVNWMFSIWDNLTKQNINVRDEKLLKLINNLN